MSNIGLATSLFKGVKGKVTLISGIQIENEGCIIADFRLTNLNNFEQGDFAHKFSFIDDRLAVFISGQVFLLSDIVEKLETIIDEINHENVDKENGILIRVLLELFREKEARNSSMIFVYLNKENNNFKMFKVKIGFCNGQYFYNIKSNFNWEVIGSGSIIAQKKFYPQREPFSLFDLYKDAREKGVDQFNVAALIEQEIKTRLNSHGPDTYSKLGVSPVMNICLIRGSNLKVIGREVEGSYINSDGTYQNWLYSLEKNQEGKCELKDHYTGQKLNVSITNNDFPFEILEDLEKFDPENREGENIDLPPYTLTQIVVPRESLELVRLVHRTRYLPWMNNKFLVCESIYGDSKVFPEDIPGQDDIEKHPILKVNEVNDKFEEELKGDILFNNSWLREYVGEENPFIIEE